MGLLWLCKRYQDVPCSYRSNTDKHNGNDHRDVPGLLYKQELPLGRYRIVSPKFHSSNPTLTLLSASQCYCALSLASNSDIGYSGCTSTCAGNKSEICGGSSRLSVFNNTAYVPPSIPQVVGDYTYKGCYTELPNGRAMGTMGLTDTKGMTVEKCVGVCAAKGQPLAALEYGSQCFCGSSISSLSTTVDDSQCQSLLCPGSKLEYCSAGSRLQMYSTQG